VWVTKFQEYMLPALLLLKSMAVNGFVRQFPTGLDMTDNTWCVWDTEHLCFHQIVVAVLAFSFGHDLSSITCMQVQFERRNSEWGYVSSATNLNKSWKFETQQLSWNAILNRGEHNLNWSRLVTLVTVATWGSPLWLLANAIRRD